MRSFFAVLLLSSVFVGCAANVCQRKEKFFRNQCSGKVAYSDPMCETFLDKCNEQQVAAAEAYVMCLESIPSQSCSLETVGQCASAHPQGVNLMCTGS